ncbi:MAG: DUF4167 domain-containing protein [Pikeienuella sp.]
MRPSQKSGRSRGKNNRNRSVGHSPNRVYESAGPEGKVRGTPQQVIDKYLSLARDAQLSGDRVTAENFLQHAEHYSRILIAAQEASAPPERREQNQPQPGADREEGDEGFGQQGRAAQPQPQQDSLALAEAGRADEGGEGDEQPRAPRQGRGRQPRRMEDAAPARAAAPEDDQPPADGLGAIEAAQGESELVETPESKAAPAARRPRRPRAKAAKPAEDVSDIAGEASAEAAE